MSRLQDSTFRATRRQGGAALVIVLWLIVLLTIMAVGHSDNARVETRLAARQLETSAARYVAEAATQMTIARLLMPEAGREVAVDGRLLTVPIGSRNALVSVRRANGLVDLNVANESILTALFTATGAEQAFAETLAARVLDWRDGDDFRHLGGAEDADYKAAGMPWTARDNRFSSIEELRYVLGMPPAMFRAISPYLTVYSGVGGVDFNVAPEFLIGAFGGASPMPARIGPNSDLLPGVRGGNGTYHINVAVPGPDGILVSSETVVRVARNAEPQYTVLNWRDRSRLLTQTVEAEGI